MHTQLTLKLQSQVKLQQIISSTLLQVSGPELEQVVARELAANPALERIHDWSFSSARRLRGGAQGTASQSARARRQQEGEGAARDGDSLLATPSAFDRLSSQLALLLSGEELARALHLLQMLDGHGYLRSSSEELAAEIGIDAPAVESLIHVLHELEPPGIGARDLRECLLIQCAHLEEAGVSCTIVRRILDEAWDEFAAQKWKPAARKLRVPVEAIGEARRLIAENFYPYPLSLIDDKPAAMALHRPDIIFQRGNGGCCGMHRVEIPGSDDYDLSASSDFQHALHARNGGGNNLSADEAAWIQLHLSRARLFIASLRQRWATLRRIGEYLAEYQVDFLEHGPRCLKPLTRVAVAEALGIHESTVSRAIRDKVVQLPDGRLILLASLFDSSLAVKAAIQELLIADKPALSDRQIAQALAEQGHSLARRTVTKYREQLAIPIGHLRRTEELSLRTR